MDSTETVTLANWRRSPWNRWAFHHVSELVPVALIPTDPTRTHRLLHISAPSVDSITLGDAW